MKLIDVMRSGYTPVSIDGVAVIGWRVDHDYGVIRFQMKDGNAKYIAEDKEVGNLNIEFIMSVKFNEDTAAAMLLSDVAPVMREDVDKLHAYKLINQKYEKSERENVRERIRAHTNLGF